MLSLRDIRDADIPVLFEQQRDPASHQMVAFTRRDPGDEAGFSAHFTKIRADPTVTLRCIDWDGELAGYLVKFLTDGEPEVGYWLGPAYWGRGIATAALTAFVQELTARPLYARVAQDNQASVRVLEKCGFRILRRERGFARARGTEIDEYVMTLGVTAA